MMISECFSSLQGEGALAGCPSFFIRTTGCRLRCRWCDTPYTSWETEGRRIAVEDLLKMVRESGMHHVVITGGEPLLQREIGQLTTLLKDSVFHITMETAGTVAPDFDCDLLSLSLKTSNSDPEGRWAERHRKLRLDLEPARRLLDRAPDFQLKFVVRGGEDIPEILEIVEKLGVGPSWKIQLMPEGRTAEDVAARAAEVAGLCREYGFRYTPRLHLSLFGGGRGV